MAVTVELRDYVASGYFLSRHAGIHDCTGIELRRVSLASDHSQRCFFPDAWALSWCNESREERLQAAAVFGITERQLDDVTAWADAAFETTFGAWSIFFDLAGARAAADSFLADATGLDLWGVGLHRSLVMSYHERTKPPPQQPGYAPVGASGTHVATGLRAAPLEMGGDILGHELLIEDIGCCFNSPESRHLDERALFQQMGVQPNGHGLIDSFESALACCQHLDAHAHETPHQITGWLPWLIVRYPIKAAARHV